MADRKIEVVISASDDYTAVMRKFNSAVGDMDGAVAKAGQVTNKLTRQLDGLTSGTDWAATGVKRFKSVLEGIAFGGVIGVISALTTHFIEQYRETARTQAEMEKLNTTVFSQAERWKLLPGPMSEVSKGLVDIYNHQLALWKLDNLGKGDVIQKEMALLNKGIEMRETAMLRMSAINEKTGQFVGGELALKVLETHNRDIVEARLRVAELSQEYKTWGTGMKMTETSVRGVNDAMAAIKAPDLVGGFTEGALSSLIMGGLDMPELSEKVGFTGLALGAAFAESFNAGTKEAENPFAIDALNYNQKYITMLENDAAYNEAYFALLDERYAREEAYEDAILDRHVTTSIQDLNTQTAVQQQIMNMKFAAANQSIALLSILGQKNKAAALAALVLQKGLAIAQVWIHTVTAAAGASAALAMIPVVGPALAAAESARIMFWGKVQMGLIAATGIAQAATGGGGPSGVGGGGGVGSIPIAPPSVSSNTDEKQRPQIVFNIENMHLLDENSVGQLMQRINTMVKDYDVELIASTTVN